MKNISILTFLFTLGANAYSQNNSLTVLDSLLHIYDQKYQNNEFEEALTAIIEADSIVLSDWGAGDLRYADLQQNRALALLNMERPSESIPFFQKSLDIREAALGAAHLKTVRNLAGLGRAHAQMGQFEQGEKLLFRAKSVLEETGTTDGIDYARLMLDFDYLYFRKSDFEEARKYSLKSLEIREQKGFTNNRDYASNLLNLAMIHNRMGEYLTAEGYFLSAKKAFEVSVGKLHPAYAACLLDFAINYQLKNEFEKAEQYYLESLRITAEAVGNNSLDYAKNAEGLAHLYTRMGNFEKAKPLYQQCMTIKEAHFGPAHPDYGLCLLNMAGYYFSTGNLNEAEKYSEEALSIMEPVLGKNHQYTISIMMNLSMLYEIQEKYEQAEPMMAEALELLETKLGASHPSYAVNLMNLGSLQTAQGKYEAAESNLLSALSLLQDAVGKETHEYTSCLDGLISLLAKTGQYIRALTYIHENSDIQSNIILRGAQHLSQSELTAYTNTFSGYLHQHFAVLQKAAPGPGKATEKAYDDVLFYKGYLLAMASRVKQLSIQDPALSARQQQLSELRQRLSAEYAKPPAARTGVQTLEDETNAIEKSLVTSVASYGETYRQVSWQEVQQILQPNEAAVEFVRFEQRTEEPPGYAALIIKAGETKPVFVPLFQEQSLIQLMRPVEKGRIKSINQIYAWSTNPTAPSIYELLWAPLKAVLKDTKTVYFSPDGLLHQLNFGAIAATPDKALTEQYHLVRLRSTRQLVFDQQQRSENGPAALFGGIKYEPDIPPSEKPERTATKKAAQPYNRTTPRSRGETWAYLDWTQTEIETIGLIAEDAGMAADMFTGHSATEESFKKLSAGIAPPQILHIATHGYFFPAPAEEASTGNEFQASEHPMIRSGLILANGNFAWKNGEPIAPGRDDGILTAYEIAQMNLNGTELVVLSACETGLGEVRGIEGVYGLQRAFKLAGAKHIIMSLWQIPDFQTQEFMTAFYFNYLTKALPIPTAFRAAQLELRNRYPEPFFWAGFVLME
ncbi:MAG: CHAT domain-containing tetratricopeptide repeat protein [Phaeodactylibacter sp.]|uniref:CHAT domain-containing protein n=1 Tax=Phaeodactylibacter sp. TaxID=1940289 RepID=UPI0032EC9277